MVNTMRNELIELVTVLGSEKNANGFRTEEHVEKAEVFASIKSVGRTEYYEAVRAGMQVNIIFVVDVDDFKLSEHEITVDGKTRKVKASKIIHDGTTYLIHRTFVQDSRLMEITCREVE